MDEIVIHGYGLDEAIGDGALVPVFRNRWSQLSGGKPIVATAALYGALSLAAIREIWNGYVVWRRDIEPTLAEEDRMFVTRMNGRRVWVVEDAAAFTVMYPEDY